MNTTSTAPRELRWFQREAVNAVYDKWAEGDRTVVVLPTGVGKSTVIAQLAVDAVAHGMRVVLLAHRRELLDQMVASVHAVDPELVHHTGFVQGGRDMPQAQIVAASFQSLASPARLSSIGPRDVILVDEVHHSPADTYSEVLALLQYNKPGARLAGFTATLQRADGGLGEIWDSIAYERTLSWALDAGFLVKPRGLTVVVPGLDTTELTVRAGDYAPGELSSAMIASVDTTVDAIRTHAAGRRMLVFGASVEHCEALAAAMSAAGVPTGLVVGTTSSDERSDLFDDFTAGRLDALVTVQVLTEGTDLPVCDCVVLARPTRSPVLFTQMVGRALRLHPGKSDALVLDLAGSTRDVAMVTLASLTPEAEHRRVSPTGDDDPGQVEPAPPRVQREGPVDMVGVDLLDGSNAVWLTTRAPDRPALDTIAFLDGENGVYAYLLPDTTGQRYAVGIIPGRSGRAYLLANGAAGTWAQAREAAEVEVSRLGKLPEKSASWRTRGKPSDGQVIFAASLDIAGAENMTRARLSDEISVVLGTRRLRSFFN